MSNPSKRWFEARGRRLELGRRTLLMGIVNVTPDSFSDGGEAYSLDLAVERALEMDRQGADILDIGGESSRPGAEPVSLEEELHRVIPVVEALQGQVKALISVDTYKPAVARAALAAGAHIINDISAGGFGADGEMIKIIAEAGAGVVLMHMQGSPRNMQVNPHYNDVVSEVRDYLSRTAVCFMNAGVKRHSILVDPGIGFGKLLEHNLELIRNLDDFQGIGAGILVGPSRKSFIGALTGRPVKERLEGTIAASIVSSFYGADIIRVHDVAEIKSALRVADAVAGRITNYELRITNYELRIRNYELRIGN